MGIYYIKLERYNGKGVIDTITVKSLEELEKIKNNLQIEEYILENNCVEVSYMDEKHQALDYQYTTYNLVESVLGIC